MRKISAHYIFTNTSKPLKYGILHVDESGKILRIINTNGVLTEEENLELYSGIICPGFINTHCHLELSHLANKMPENIGLVDFIREVGIQRKIASIGDICNKMETAIKQMINNGIVAAGDISNSPDSIVVKKKSGLYFHNFIELLGIDNDKAADIFENGMNLLYIFRKNELTSTLTPHSSYSISPQLFQMINDYLNKNDEIVTIHNQETNDENELFQGKQNRLLNFLRKVSYNPKNIHFTDSGFYSSIQSVFKYISHAKKILLVHNLYTSEKDIIALNNHLNRIFWVLCPNSNLYIEKKLPPVNLIRKYSDQITIGTDSLASNHQLCVLEELKTISDYFPDIPIEELIKWGTLNGAKSLGIEDKYGSFEEGKTPGINLISKVDLKELKIIQESKIVNLNKNY